MLTPAYCVITSIFLRHLLIIAAATQQLQAMILFGEDLGPHFSYTLADQKPASETLLNFPFTRSISYKVHSLLSQRLQ